MYALNAVWPVLKNSCSAELVLRAWMIASCSFLVRIVVRPIRTLASVMRFSSQRISGVIGVVVSADDGDDGASCCWCWCWCWCWWWCWWCEGVRICPFLMHLRIRIILYVSATSVSASYTVLSASISRINLKISICIIPRIIDRISDSCWLLLAGVSVISWRNLYLYLRPVI